MHAGIAADRYALDIDAERGQQLLRHRPDAEHADRRGDGRRLGHDDVAAHGGEIATRGRHVAHRDNDGLAGGACPADRVGDGIGGGVGAAGRVDAQHDGAHVLGLRGVFQRFDDVLGIGRRLVLERAAAAAAGHDRAAGAHQSDNFTAGLWARFVAGIFRQRHQLAFAVGALIDVLQGVGPVADLVDQAVAPGLLGFERCIIDQTAKLAGLHLPIARHVGHELAEQAVDQLLQILAGGAGIAGFRERIGGALVFVALAALDLDAELVEPALEERGFDGDAGDAEAAARLQPDLLERSGKIVIGDMISPAAQGFSETHGELALAAEVGDRLTQLLDAREPARLVADLDVQTHNARIVGGLPEKLHGLDDVARAAEQAAAQQAGRGRLRRQRAQVEREDHLLRQWLGRKGTRGEEGGAGDDRQQDEGADGRKKADDETSHAKFPLNERNAPAITG